MHQYMCIPKCPSHYFEKNKVCQRIFFYVNLKECHYSCKECFNAAKYGCIDCISSRLFWNSQCLIDCPSGFYPSYELGKCLKCGESCLTCTSENECIECNKGYYRIQNTNTCVLKEDCPYGTFADDLEIMCKTCFIACLTCFGPTNKECILCNFARGFGRTQGEVGECLMMICSESEYLKLDFTVNKASCKPCHKSCKSCDEEGPLNCIECRKGLKGFPTGNRNHVKCLSCEQYLYGYFTAPDYSCKGIFFRELILQKYVAMG